MGSLLAQYLAQSRRSVEVLGGKVGKVRGVCENPGAREGAGDAQVG